MTNNNITLSDNSLFQFLFFHPFTKMYIIFSVNNETNTEKCNFKIYSIVVLLILINMELRDLIVQLISSYLLFKYTNQIQDLAACTENDYVCSR